MLGRLPLSGRLTSLHPFPLSYFCQPPLGPSCRRCRRGRRRRRRSSRATTRCRWCRRVPVTAAPPPLRLRHARRVAGALLVMRDVLAHCRRAHAGRSPAAVDVRALPRRGGRAGARVVGRRVTRDRRRTVGRRAARVGAGPRVVARADAGAAVRTVRRRAAAVGAGPRVVGAPRSRRSDSAGSSTG